MLFTLIDTRKAQGLINVDFKFENVLDMISPKKVMNDIKQVRKEIHYLYDKYEELEDEDPKKLDIGDKLNYKFEEASKNYNNVMAMLLWQLKISRQDFFSHSQLLHSRTRH